MFTAFKTMGRYDGDIMGLLSLFNFFLCFIHFELSEVSAYKMAGVTKQALPGVTHAQLLR